jgi:hypothetical protein
VIVWNFLGFGCHTERERWPAPAVCRGAGRRWLGHGVREVDEVVSGNAKEVDSGRRAGSLRAAEEVVEG